MSVCGGGGGAEAREPSPTSRGSAKDGEAAHVNLGKSQRQPASDPRGSETTQGGKSDKPQSPRTSGETPDLGFWRDPEGPRAPGRDVRSGQPPGEGGVYRRPPHPPGALWGLLGREQPAHREAAQNTWPSLPTQMDRWSGGVSHRGDGAGPGGRLPAPSQGNWDPDDTEMQSPAGSLSSEGCTGTNGGAGGDLWLLVAIETPRKFSGSHTSPPATKLCLGHDHRQSWVFLDSWTLRGGRGDTVLQTVDGGAGTLTHRCCQSKVKG